MKDIGLIARKNKDEALSLVKNDFGSDIIDINTFINKCINASKYNEDHFVIPSHYGVKYTSDSSCIAWSLFNKEDIPNDINLESEDLGFLLTGWYQFYNGIGRAFGTDPIVKKTNARILVKQFRGLDV